MAVDAVQRSAPSGPHQQGDCPSPLEAGVVEALRTVFDPEIPVSIYDLGLVYVIDIDETGHTYIGMTLTAPGCPVAGEIPKWVQDAVAPVDGIKSVDVEILWDPPWTPDNMSEAAKLDLGMF
ncbi:SUF system Fe-S cluster assembly protein [Sneathiella glossodoripedis]|uniref:SUF system Fe-S cluster assembly protein n=1 Tax=Sneathiella glossodoripedis TaxID=418853 RepID=UPI0004712C0D|nr:SUF system Fe-S cluster assembly protein [Sneathiella glossodoripedis]